MQPEKIHQRTQANQPEIPRLRSDRLFLYIALASISVLFLSLTLAYVYARVLQPAAALHLPLIFHANTLIIIVSSLSFRFAVQATGLNEHKNYLYGLAITFGLGAAFLIFQLMGWMELFSGGVNLRNSQSGAYLFLISGVHAGHILGGLVVLGVALFRAYAREKDPVKMLVYIAQPTDHRQIKLLETYWHFVDGLWVYLYLFFVINMLF